MADVFDSLGFSEEKAPSSSAPSTSGSDPFSSLGFKEESQQSPGMGEAALRGGAQGLSLGFADELAGGVAGLKDTGHFHDKYVEARDAWRHADDAAKTAHPYAFGAGELAGSIPSITALGATGLGAVGAAAAAGGIGALGNSKADIANQGMSAVPQAAQDTAVGAAAGGVLGKAGQMIGQKFAGGAADLAQEQANKFAVKSLGPRAADYRKLLTQDKVQDLGQMLNDSGVIRPLQSTKGVYENLADKTNQIGEQLGDVMSVHADTPVANTGELANSINAQVEPDLKHVPGGPKTLSNFQDYLADQVVPAGDEAGNLNLGDAWEMRKGIDQGINWDKAYSQMAGNQQALATARRELQDRIATAAPEEAQDLFKQYHLLETAESIAQKRTAAQMANRGASLTDYAAAGLGEGAHEGGGFGNGLTGLVTGGLHNAVRTRGTTTAAWTLDQLSGALRSSPQSFGAYAAPLIQASQRGDNALAATNYVLSQQSPEYRALMTKLTGNDK